MPAITKTTRDKFIGKEFNFLTLEKYELRWEEGDKQGFTFWECKCRCGNRIWVRQDYITLGRKKHCGKCDLRKWKNGKNHTYWKGVGDIPHTYFSQIKKHSSDIGKEFNLELDYLWALFVEQNKICKLSGLKIEFAKTEKNNRLGLCTASLDRIDSDIGYIPGNVQWLHKSINRIKREFAQDLFIKYCKLINNKNTNNDNFKNINLEDICDTYYTHLRRGADIRKFEFDISKKDILNLYYEQNGLCNLSGVEIEFATKQKLMKFCNASIDRIDSTKGYTIDNTQIVDKIVNLMKWDYDQEYFKTLCEAVAKHN